jgi:DNA-directed RNA polymerase subunit RPC12/RpoP
MVKKNGVICGQCKKDIKEIWFRSDDNARCTDCFE